MIAALALHAHVALLFGWFLTSLPSHQRRGERRPPEYRGLREGRVDLPTEIVGSRQNNTQAPRDRQVVNAAAKVATMEEPGLARRLFSPKRIAVLFLGLFILTVSAVAKAGGNPSGRRNDAPRIVVAKAISQAAVCFALGYRFARVVLRSIRSVGSRWPSSTSDSTPASRLAVTGFIPLKRACARRSASSRFTDTKEGAVSVAQTLAYLHFRNWIRHSSSRGRRPHARRGNPSR